MQEAERAFAAQQMIANGTIKDRAMSMTGASAGVMKYMASLNITSISEMTFAQRVRASTIALKEQALAWAATPMGMATIAVTGISLLISGFKAWKQNIQETRQELMQLGQQAADTNKQLYDLISQYSKLGKDGQIDLSDQETAKGIQEQIVELVGDQAKNIDLVNGKYDKEIEKLQQIKALGVGDSYNDISRAAKSAEANLRDGYTSKGFDGSAAHTIMAGSYQTQSESNAIKKVMGENGFEDFMSETQGVYKFKADMTSPEKMVESYYKAVELASVIARDYGEDIENSEGALYDFYNNLNKFIDNNKEDVEAYSAAIKNLHTMDANSELANYLKTNDIDSQDAFDSYIEGIQNSTEYSDAYKQVLIDVANDAFPQFSNAAKDAGENANKMTVSLSDLKKASDNISSLSSAFKELSDDGYITTETISKIQEATELSGDEWKEYENKLLTAKKGSSEFNQILSDLTYKILENAFGTEGLANVTEEQIAAVLRENGVTNASAVAHQISARAKYEEYLQTIDLNNVTAEETNELIRLAQQCGITQQQIGFLTTAMEVLANTDLNLADKSAQLLQMAASAGIAMVAVGEASSILADMQSGSAGALRRQEASGKSMTDLYKASIQEILVYFGGLGNQISGIYTGGGSKGGGSSSKSDFDDSYYSIIDALIEDGEKEIEKLEKDREILNRQFENALDTGNKEQAEILRAKLAENAKAQKDILHNQNELYRNKRGELLQSLYQYAPSLSGKVWNEISEVDLINIENELNKKSETGSDNDKNQAKYNLNQFKGIVDDLKAINDVIEENSNAWWEADEAQKEYWQSLIDFQDDYSNTWIDNQKAFDKLSEEEELKAYGRMINNNKEFQKQILNDMTLSAEAKLELVKETNDKIIEIEKEAYDLRKQIATDRLNHNSSQISSLKTLLQAYYDVRNAVTDAQHEISKELAASKVMYEYLNEETRKLLFNQEDYNTLNEKLIDIQAEAEKLQNRYNQDILSATEENLEQITSQYEMQFDLLMKSYEISKAELEVAKKRQQLDNVLNERNVRMFVNGQWQWVANTQDVINAQNELADAEYEAKQSKLDLQQTEAMNRLTQAEDMLTTAINEIENGVTSLGNSLSTVYSEHVPALGEICDEAANTIRNFANGLTGSDSASLKSSGYNNGGKKISFDPNIDYSALMAYYTPGSRQWERLNERRNAKIDAMGLNYTKYATGTRSTKSGNALMGEEGFEAFINNNGHLIPINQPTLFTGIGAGGTVFNTEQMANLRSLWDLSNVGTANYGSLVNRTISQTSGDVNCNNITINGMTVDGGSADGQALVNALRRYVGNH